MKKAIGFFMLLLTTCMLFTACEKEEDPPDMTLEDWDEHNFSGTLTVYYTNVYPEWNVSEQMTVSIDGPLAIITISGTTLSYSGETLVSDDSKITRSGSWLIEPVSHFEGDPDDPDIFVDANITIQNDVQRIYAKDDHGNWIQVNEVDFSGLTPDSDLTFRFADALWANGSVVSVSTATGSITWRLDLLTSITP